MQEKVEEGLKEVQGLMYYLSQSTLLINLLIMMTIWLSIAFSQFLLNCLFNTVDEIYTSAVFMSISEILAYVTAAIVFYFTGVRVSLVFAFGIAFLGGATIIAYGNEH